MNTTKKLKLRCYVCGKPIEPAEICLVSMSTDAVDRVFVMHGGNCVAQVEGGSAVLVVTKR